MKKTIENYIQELSLEYKKPGGIYMFPASEALRLIDTLEKENRRILGIDAFFLKKEGTQPSIADSTNYSNSPLGCWSASKQHITARVNMGIFYEIVI